MTKAPATHAATWIGLVLICATVVVAGMLIALASGPRAQREGQVICADQPMRPGQYCAPLHGNDRLTYEELREAQHGARPPDVPFLILGLVLVGSGVSGLVWLAHARGGRAPC